MSKSTKDSAETSPSPYSFLKRRKSALAKVAASLTVCLMAYLGTKMNTTSNAEERMERDILEVDSIGNFELLKRISLNYTDVTITKRRSKDTGLKVVRRAHYQWLLCRCDRKYAFLLFPIISTDSVQYLTTVVALTPSNTSYFTDLSSIHTPMRCKG
jgi:hypothetical protein